MCVYAYTYTIFSTEIYVFHDVKSPPIFPVKCLDHSHSLRVLLAKL